jgi:hypothetical protein
VRPFVAEHGPFKAVTAIAMFYDLDDPVRFLEDVKSVLAPNGLIVIQMNYLVTMLERNGYDNILHEHLTYFSLNSLVPALRRAGLEVIDVSTNEVNGGSFRVYCAPRGTRTVPGGADRIERLAARESRFELVNRDTYAEFAGRVRQIRKETREVVNKALKAKKTIYAYGASTRGLVILEYCGLDGEMIAGAAERNPEKWGRTYAGTGIRCVSEDEAREKADYFLILPHHFLPEFVVREAEWLARGGRFIVPLPAVRVVGPEGVEMANDPVMAGAADAED